MEDPTRPPEAPRYIGPYRVLDELGRGGMGTVYRAEQRDPVRRLVAIKVVSEGMSTKDVLARFDLERRALAAMNHRTIAKVFDAGSTESGQPYFVMEYVEGLPLTDYCDRHKLTVVQRLRLFQLVCQGVQHAHQKGVIHRDLKPGNVLIAREGKEPVPKILDFGLAKATNREFLTVTVFTEQQRVLGTPEYMSPEQAAGNTDLVDARSDIYSLGVMLYELLSGELPFSTAHLRKVGHLEAMRIVREVEPAKPSSRVTSLGGLGDEHSQRRQASGNALARAIRGDLDWIVMRALSKEPERRYESADALAMDVQRHLDHEPVLAGPPSALYRLRKVVRRHRVQFAAAAVVFLTLGAATIVSQREFRRAEDEAGRATLAAQAADERRQEADEERARAELAVAEERYGRGKLLARQGQLEDALASIDAALTHPDLADRPEILIERARALSSLGRYRDVFNALEQLESLELTPRQRAGLFFVELVRDIRSGAPAAKVRKRIEARLDDAELTEADRAFAGAMIAPDIFVAHEQLMAAFRMDPWRYELVGMLGAISYLVRDAASLERAAWSAELLAPASDLAKLLKAYGAILRRDDSQLRSIELAEPLGDVMRMLGKAESTLEERLIECAIYSGAELQVALKKLKSASASFQSTSIQAQQWFAELVARDSERPVSMMSVPVFADLMTLLRPGSSPLTLLGLATAKPPTIEEREAAARALPIASNLHAVGLARSTAKDYRGAESAFLAATEAREIGIGGYHLVARLELVFIQRRLAELPNTDPEDRRAIRGRLSKTIDEVLANAHFGPPIAAYVCRQMELGGQFNLLERVALHWRALEPESPQARLAHARALFELGAYARVVLILDAIPESARPDDWAEFRAAAIGKVGSIGFPARAVPLAAYEQSRGEGK